MKLEPGRNAYPIAQRGQIMYLHLDTGESGRGSDLFVLMPISAGQMRSMVDGATGQAQGRPRYGSAMDGQIVLWPTPDRAYGLIVTIQPPEVTL